MRREHGQIPESKKHGHDRTSCCASRCPQDWLGQLQSPIVVKAPDSHQLSVCQDVAIAGSVLLHIIINLRQRLPELEADYATPVVNHMAGPLIGGFYISWGAVRSLVRRECRIKKRCIRYESLDDSGHVPHVVVQGRHMDWYVPRSVGGDVSEAIAERSHQSVCHVAIDAGAYSYFATDGTFRSRHGQLSRDMAVG